MRHYSRGGARRSRRTPHGAAKTEIDDTHAQLGSWARELSQKAGQARKLIDELLAGDGKSPGLPGPARTSSGKSDSDASELVKITTEAQQEEKDLNAKVSSLLEDVATQTFVFRDDISDSDLLSEVSEQVVLQIPKVGLWKSWSEQQRASKVRQTIEMISESVETK